MPRPAGRKVRRHPDGTELATLYAEVDPSVKEFFDRVAAALNISRSEAVEVVVRRLLAALGGGPDALPDWVLQRMAEEQLVLEDRAPHSVAA
jgi:predicted NBD/HSP70 family sugar kinase